MNHCEFNIVYTVLHELLTGVRVRSGLLAGVQGVRYTK